MRDKTLTSDNKEFSTAKNKIIIAVICFAFIVILETMVLVCRALNCDITRNIISAIAILIISGTNIYMCEHKVKVNRVNLGLMMILEVLIIYMQLCFA